MIKRGDFDQVAVIDMKMSENDTFRWIWSIL